MRFIIDGTEYASSDIGDMTPRDMLAMAKQAGMGVQTWARTVAQIERLAPAPDGGGVVVLTEDEAKANPELCEPDLMFDSEPHLRAFFILVWLSRRTSGQPTLTFEESSSVPWSAYEILPDLDDDEPEGETPDPTQPSAGAVDAATAAEASPTS
jgi:hypothetical protein